jgi:hypothetical protein
MGNDEAPGEAGKRPAVAPVIRAGCITLVLIGVVSLLLAFPAIVNPGSVRCSLARSVVEEANDDGKDFNDVDTGGREAGNVECDEALVLAEGVRRNEKSDKTVNIPSAGLIRNRGFMSAIVAVGQMVTGFFTISLQRRWRTAALIFAVLGVVVPVLGLLSVAVLGFVVYALGFSSASREVWPGKPRGST